MTPTARIALTVATVVVVAFGLFSASVAIWGSWWRFPDMPTAEEWSAIFGASALIALAFAWYQIRQVDQSNKALIASNELARRVNIEAIRPRVQVALEIDRSVPKGRGEAANGALYIAARNIGVSPARDVRLKVTPPFTSLEKFFKHGMMGKHFTEVNEIFNGEVHFQTLNPGNSYIWLLGRVPGLFKVGSGIPRRWEVETEYKGTASPEPFRETFILDLDVEKHIEFPVDPLVRIGRDIEVVGDHLKAIKSSVPTEIGLSDDSVIALTRRSLRKRSSATVTRRAPAWLRKRR
jgi:hypothetical protein